MMTKECNQLIQKKHMNMEQAKIYDFVSEKEEIKCNSIIKR